VYLHAWMVQGAQLADASFAMLLSRQLDADVYNVQQVHHGCRQIPTSPYAGARFFSADVALTFEAVRQAVSDARTVVNHVLALSAYDEVGMLGVSLGGSISLITACREPRLSWVVPVVSHLDIADTVRRAPIAVRARRQLEAWGVSMDELSRTNRALLGWLSPAIAPERLLLVPAKHDLCMRPEAVQSLLDRWTGVAATWLPGGHISSVLSLGARLPMIRTLIDASMQRREAAPVSRVVSSAKAA
jgi:hypothetical protein